MLTLIFSCEDCSVLKINSCRWRRTCVGCAHCTNVLVATKLLTLRNRLYMISHDVRSIGKSASVAMEVKLAGNDLILERLALERFEEELNFISFSFFLTSIRY